MWRKLHWMHTRRPEKWILPHFCSTPQCRASKECDRSTSNKWLSCPNMSGEDSTPGLALSQWHSGETVQNNNISALPISHDWLGGRTSILSINFPPYALSSTSVFRDLLVAVGGSWCYVCIPRLFNNDWAIEKKKNWGFDSWHIVLAFTACDRSSYTLPRL